MKHRIYVYMVCLPNAPVAHEYLPFNLGIVTHRER